MRFDQIEEMVYGKARITRTTTGVLRKTMIRQRIFEEKLSVSPYFLHHHEDNNEAGMLLVNVLSLKTLGVYSFIIF